MASGKWREAGGEWQVFNGKKFYLWTFLLSVVTWAVFSWPLPLHIHDGIPASSHNTGRQTVRHMVPGDHLQLLYHFWLSKDALFGPTPMGYDLYELNPGDDEARREKGSRYYLPFTLVFALGDALVSQPFGWNLTAIVSLWATLLFTYLLVRRYTKERWCALLAAFLAIILPYRWFNLLSGSPTGLGMMWVPIALLGLDLMVRKHSPWGTVLAGVSILLSRWIDTHTIFFAGLIAPVWCAVAYFHDRETFLPSKEEWRKLLIAASPLVIFAILVILAALETNKGLEHADAGQPGGRPFTEVLIFTARPSALWSLSTEGAGREVYVGVVLSLAVVACAVGFVWQLLRERKRRYYRLTAGALVLLAIVGVMFLACCPRIQPGGERMWMLLRKVIPPFAMIRQPAKVFILLPTLLAVAFAMFLPPALAAIRRPRRLVFAFGVLTAILVIDYRVRIRPTICTLDAEQNAYRAVAEDARAAGQDPRLMVVPLWPGNSHWSSLDIYYASLYRIRMVNGYRPSKRQPYVDKVYTPFECFNAGCFPDERLDELMEWGVPYLALHENAFPEKVSPFAVSHTLHAMLAHPRIKFMTQDGPVWAFKIVDAPEGVHAPLPDWDYRFPTRLWQGERCDSTNAVAEEAADTSGGRFLRLADTNSFAMTGCFPVPSMSGLCYLVRLRGKGECSAFVHTPGEETPFRAIAALTSPDSDTQWRWETVPIPRSDVYREVQLELRPSLGYADVDLVVLAADQWDPMQPIDELVLPAPVFFHAGHTDLAAGEVVLMPVREPADAIFYGPKLPVPAGTYEIEMAYSTDAPDGTRLGTLKPRYPSPRTKPADVIAGQPAKLTYVMDTNLRLSADFHYSAKAPMRIRSVTIRGRGE